MRKVDDGKKKKNKKRKKKTVVFSGHYVIASSRPPERRPLERRTLMSIVATTSFASSLPPERRCPNEDRWNAARSCQKHSLYFSLKNPGGRGSSLSEGTNMLDPNENTAKLKIPRLYVEPIKNYQLSVLLIFNPY